MNESILSLNAITELETVLQTADIDLTKWGHGGAKSLTDLWTEISAGDCLIEQSPLCRLVRVVSVVIERDGRQLREAAQELTDGRIRTRNLPPSEKIRQGESIYTAALRCLQEELEVDSNQIAWLTNPQTKMIEIATSPSYPGLLSCYERHIVSADIPTLPTADFRIRNRAAETGDPIIAHQWAWTTD